MPLEYLDKFNKLPKELKEFINSEETASSIDRLNAEYGIELADLLIKIVTKDISVEDLPYILETQFLLNEIEAREVTDILISQVLLPTKGYLDLPEVKESASIGLSKRVPSFYKKKIKASEIVDKIINNQSLSFDDNNLEVRFRELVVSTLKEVRTPAELKEMLIRSSKIGGLEYNSQITENLVAFVSRILEQIKQGVIVLEEEASLPAKEETAKPRDEIMPKKRFLLRKKEPQKIETNDRFKLKRQALPAFKPSYASLSREHLVKKDLPKAVFQTKPKTNPLESGWSGFKPVTRAVFEEKPPEEIRSIPQRSAKKIEPAKAIETGLPVVKRFEFSEERPRLEDIKTPVRVMGPIEELKSMGLKEFRQLSSDPTSAAQIVKSKVDLMEEESFEKKSEAIKAWQQSPLFQKYLQIGTKSFEGEKSIDRVIADDEESGKGNLSLEEFKAISDLNQQLRF